MAEPKKRGRKAHITLAVVQRVAERVGLGVPLNYACLLEDNPKINTESFQRALQRNPEFVHPYKAAQARFLESQFRWFAVHDDWRARALFLERRHSNEFSKPPEQLNVISTVIGLPDDYLKRFQEDAKKL